MLKSLTTPMSLPRLLTSWRADPSIAENIQAWREFPARLAQTLPFPTWLHPALIDALPALRISSLYTHQVECLELARQGRSWIVAAGTASGKSLCYHLSILDELLRHPQARTLYLFPTKALAQDQASSLRLLLDFLPGFDDSASESSNRRSPPPLAIYDGDTPSQARPAIRSSARLLFTNPDMLHLGILPHHTAWADFLRGLRYVVLDEAHIYRGVFGSHVANVLRRLSRVARFYGARPQFLLTSATIANPLELAQRLTETDVVLVEQDGAARGPKTFLIYNPPVVDPDLGLRRSALQESVRLADDLLAHGLQIILFARSRRTVELILAYLINRSPPGAGASSLSSLLPGAPSGLPADRSIRGYRSGYLPAQRREIERGLRQGEVRAVVATNALELGIDIGGLGAALLVGYPGTIAALRQQAGRAGRGLDPSLAVLIATADPIDQFLAAHPDYLFERSPEHALINPDNPLILLDHLRCAAFELPFQSGDSFGALDTRELSAYLTFLQEEGVLHTSGLKYFWMADSYPAQSISLRSASANPVSLQMVDESIPDHLLTIGQVDRASAAWMVHPRAIYLHEAETYLVESLDLEGGVARLRRLESDYYTLPHRETTVALVQLHDTLHTKGGDKSHGELLVTSQVTGFRSVRWFTHENLGLEPLDLPPTELLTTGYWLSLSTETVDRLKESGLWNNQPIDYGPNWEVQRQRARQRDGFRCQVCGALEGDSPGQRRLLHVHHKTPFRTFPSYLQANQLENLVTLCPECHRRVETAVRVRSGLAGLGYVLGNLAPFFLMCDSGDLGVHSDPQSPLADGRPAVVIYEQTPAGLGFSARLFELHDELLARALELVSACPCSDGCPSCTGPGGEQGQGGKAETLAILQAL